MVVQFAIGGAFLPFLSLHFRDQRLDFKQIGWIYFTASLISATMPLLWGIVADRFLRVDRLLLVLHLLGAAAIFLLSLEDTFSGLLLAYGFWSATSWPSGALFNAFCYHSLASPEKQYGKLRMWGSVGWMLPSLPVWLWLSLQGNKDVHFVLWLAAAVEAGFLFLAFILPAAPSESGLPAGAGESRGQAEGWSEGEGEALPFKAAFFRLLSQPGFLVLLFIAFLMYWSHTVNFYYSPVYLEQCGLPRQWIGPQQSLGVALEVMTFSSLPWALRRFGYLGSLSLGCGAMLLRQLIFVFSQDTRLLVASSLLSGVSVVLYLTPLSLAIDEIAGRKVRASAQTLLLIAGPGFGSMASHLVSGMLADQPRFGLAAVFLSAALTALLSIGLMPFGLVGFLERRRSRPEAVKSGL